METMDRKEERTGFQERTPFRPSYDLQTDFVMVYGIDEMMPRRIQEWKDQGYIVHLMTGVAWGQYQGYLNGDIDGKSHWDEAQKNKHGKSILHGKDVPYMVPTIAYSNFLTERIKIAVDAGVEAIHLEEPEFWVEGGYSEAFKREWQIYYKESWIPPHQSADAQYRASHLKAYLYTRCLNRLCSELKEYALAKYNRLLHFYVPTHSLINYTQWRIISPESMLLDLPAIDGYIAQIWTGTSRTPNMYEGVRKERTFETAFLEYGMMQELVSGTDRKLWFLHDPIEDNPRHTWSDYRRNYFKSVVASLLHPGVSRYEVSPWPNRVFEGEYPKETGIGLETIPEDYATILLTVMHTLRNMKQTDIQGQAENIGVLVSDSMLYQRGKVSNQTNEQNARYDGTDPNSVTNQQDVELLNFSSFYGLALPLLKRGLWVRPVQLDNVRRFSNYLNQHRLLILSYEFLKPESPDMHNAIAQWVKEGGILVYVGDDQDSYHEVREWWNTGKRQYNSPREHLFETLGLASETQQGIYNIDKGILGYLSLSPDECAQNKGKADLLMKTIADSTEVHGDEITLDEKNYFLLQRGPYKIGAVLDESVSSDPLEIKGNLVDLFDSQLTIMNGVELKPGENTLLFDLDYDPPKQEVRLISASSRVEEMNQNKNGFEMIVKGPEKIEAAARLFCPKKPSKANLVIGDRSESIDYEWDKESGTLFFNYYHHSKKVTKIQLKW